MLCFMVLTNYLEWQKKEKLGERIAALQQLVSPFGKVNWEFVNLFDQ